MRMIIAILFIAGCAPKMMPAQQQRTSIEVTFSTEIEGYYYIQEYKNKWQNIAELKGIGKLTDTINYQPGLYRVKCERDSSQIFNIK